MTYVNIYVSMLLKESDIMPRFDRTGPNGEGPRTGRGLGDCPTNQNVKTDDKQVNNNDSQVYGRGLGRGLSRGPRRGM